jgi:hypothetical protein
MMLLIKVFKNQYKINFLISCLCLLIFQNAEAQIPPSWQNYLDAQTTGAQPILPNFSFSGYRFSEESLPDVSPWTVFDVTNYGAVAGDGNYDDAAIQAAINAAQASNGPAVVYFPAGRFRVSSDNDITKKIQVSRSHIVLKGSGSGTSGTEIFMDKKRVKNGHWQFLFAPLTTSTSTLATITNPALRNDYTITVSTTANLSIGQNVYISHKSQEFASAHYDNLVVPFNDWFRLKNNYTENGVAKSGGMSVHENHLITAINGNVVTFKNPIQIDLPAISGKSYTLRNLTTIEEVGVEDIRFTGNWPSVGETFDHHKNDTHDYAWNAVRLANVSNAWVKNCEFKDWNQAMDIQQSIAVTVQDVLITGKMGHASFITRRSYGLLFRDCEDQAGMLHGPGVGYSGVSTVYLRCKMKNNQSIDSHSGSPYVSLLDDVSGGGLLKGNGGPWQSYPHHGRHFVFWNFKHSTSSSSYNYDFWKTAASPRPQNNFAEPYFVGFQSGSRTVNFTGEGLDELRGQQVEPSSLFEAQLNLRFAPTAPNNLVGLHNASQIDLAWDDNSSDEDGFIIERSNSSGTSWTPIATLGPNVTVYSDTNTNITSSIFSYLYRVKSEKGTAFSEPTNEVLMESGELPTAPSSLVGLQNVSQIDLTWDDNSSNEDGFIVERSNSSGTSWTPIATLGANVTVYSDTNIASSAFSYLYRVKAEKGTAFSEPTNEVLVESVEEPPSSSICIEPEDGSLGSPLTVITDGNASGGEGIYVPSGNISAGTPPVDGHVSMNFDTDSGSFSIWGRTIMTSTGSNSMWVRIDDQSWFIWNNNDISASWTWDKITTVSLTPGSHTITFAYREPEVKLDQLFITGDGGYTPTDIVSCQTLTTWKEEIPTNEKFLLYPNPVKNNINIKLTGWDTDNVNIKVINLQGQTVLTLIDKKQIVGSKLLSFDISQLAKGVYFIQLTASSIQRVKRIIVF